MDKGREVYIFIIADDTLEHIESTTTRMSVVITNLIHVINQSVKPPPLS